MNDYYGYDYNYGYDYGYSTTANLITMILYLLILLINLVAMWKIFSKAGKPGWAAIIPFYNLYVFFDITWGKGSKFWLLLIPIYNIILSIQTQLKLATVFGKSTGFGVGLIFLPLIFLLILAFGKSKYVGVPQPVGYAPGGYMPQGGYGYQQAPPQGGYGYQQAPPQQGGQGFQQAPPQQGGYGYQQAPPQPTEAPRMDQSVSAPNVGADPQANICAKCGLQNPAGGRFCQNCGGPL